MANSTDKSDVAIALAGLLNTAFAVQSPSPVALSNATVNGQSVNMSIFRRWPTTDDLQKDVVDAGGVYIGITTPAITRDVTRHQGDWSVVSKAPITATLTVAGASVTISGMGSASNLIGIGYGGVGWSYRPSDADTDQTMANALGSLIPNAVVTVNSITLATNFPISANAVSDVTSSSEIGSVVQRFKMTVWAPDDSLMDAVARTIFNTIQSANYITMPDGSQTQPPMPRGSPDHQELESIGLFCRDVDFDIEYPIYLQEVDPAVLFVGGNINGVKFGTIKPS